MELRTERNWSPRQIMMNSLIREAEIASNMDITPTNYGIDLDGPVADEDIGTVEVPETLAPLDEEDLLEFLAVCGP